MIAGFRLPWSDCLVGSHLDYVRMVVLVVAGRVVAGHVRSLTMDQPPLGAFEMCEILEYWER